MNINDLLMVIMCILLIVCLKFMIYFFRAISALKGFKGMDLYTMNRTQLEQHVGPERCDELFYAFRGT